VLIPSRPVGDVVGLPVVIDTFAVPMLAFVAKAEI
jgi:hypothetical protein